MEVRRNNAVLYPFKTNWKSACVDNVDWLIDKELIFRGEHVLFFFFFFSFFAPTMIYNLRMDWFNDVFKLSDMSS